MDKVGNSIHIKGRFWVFIPIVLVATWRISNIDISTVHCRLNACNPLKFICTHLNAQMTPISIFITIVHNGKTSLTIY